MSKHRGEAISAWSEMLYRRRMAEANEAGRKRAGKRDGEPVITSETKVTIAPSVRHDPRYQVAPGEKVPPVFSAMPLGATLEAA